jgi:hypothetical protein
VVHLLETLEIPYMVAGSFASSFHGKPRTTHDADIVIDPAPATLDQLVALCAAGGFYVDLDTARDALRRRRQFNLIETASAFKLDLIIRKDRPFSREEFQRRRLVALSEHTRLAMASAEDTILAKLEWAKSGGGSERQLSDVRGILEVQRGRLDLEYIERWARELDTWDLWQDVTR